MAETTHPGTAAEETQRANEWVQFCELVMNAAGRRLMPGARILDFGCGQGSMVRAFIEAGYNAQGCDFNVPEEDERLRNIEHPYRLPYDDASFDFVASTQVFEHVRDHEAAFREIRRVLVPGASTLHLFPPKWRPIEPHVSVPFATVVHAKTWLYMWALTGIRNQFQSGKGPLEVMRLNSDYLRGHTNYVGRKALDRMARRWFEEVLFAERLIFLTTTRRDGQLLAPLVMRSPMLERLFSATRARLMLMRRADD